MIPRCTFADEVFENGEQFIKQYWNCPVVWIPGSVIDWWARYCHHKEFPSAPMPAYDDVSPRWSAAIGLYMGEYNQTRKQVTEGRYG